MKGKLRLLLCHGVLYHLGLNTHLRRGNLDHLMQDQKLLRKKFFSGSWRHKRCLITASGFFEKNILLEKRIIELFG